MNQRQTQRKSEANIKALLASKDCRDPSLANYRRSLIPEETLLSESLGKGLAKIQSLRLKLRL